MTGSNDASTPTSAPRSSWLDRGIVAFLTLMALAEWLRPPAKVWPWLTLALALASIASILWRRAFPFAVVMLAFGAQHAVRLLSIATDSDWSGLMATIGLVLLPYSLVRRADNTQVAIGLAVILFGPLLMFARNPTNLPEATAATILLMVPAALGAVARARDAERERELERAKLLERAQIARELHDTVAHHVCAVIVEAQAAKDLAETDPDAPRQALDVIEEAASRMLTDMRQMVRVLRHEQPAAFAPLPGIADILRLAEERRAELSIEVAATGDLDDLAPTLTAALYRIAQESVTNAIRHAVDASRVAVRIDGGPNLVTLEVRDDGVYLDHSPATEGFGLVGMAERAALLGGTFSAGPHPLKGWMVKAVFPRKETRL